MLKEIHTADHTKVFFDTENIVSVRRTEEKEMEVALSCGREFLAQAENRKSADRLFAELACFAEG